MSDPDDYTVGWICALRVESIAAQELLDEEHEDADYISPNDNNTYKLGAIGRHNVVIATLSEYGVASAANAARDLLHTFPNIRIGLMVGIGAGVPSERHDIRLGDVVVSTPTAGEPGVFQYDFGKAVQNQDFHYTRLLSQPPTILRTAVTGLRIQYERKGHTLDETVSDILQTNKKRRKFQRPHSNTDVLFKADVVHDVGRCIVCAKIPSTILERDRRDEYEDDPQIHYGLIATGNRVIKNSLLRDKLTSEKDILCFEMEAAGLMNDFPCLVIRGICHYAGSHENKRWQGFAAIVAATYAKDLLHQIPSRKIKEEKRIRDLLSGLATVTAEAKATLSDLRSNIESNQERMILDWLTNIDFRSQHNDFIRKYHEGTGQWLLNSEEYRTWKASNKKTLFCPGIPGAGKTILSSLVIENLVSSFQGDPGTVVAYIYCDFRRDDSKSAEDLLASILKQVCTRCQTLPKTMRSLYEKLKPSGRQPKLSELCELLGSATASLSRVFIVVDALDECIKRARTPLISTLFGLQRNNDVNIFATSRRIPEVEARFQDCLSLEIVAHSEDISRFVEDQILQLPAYDPNKIGLKELIKTEISSAAQGMFLLVELYLKSLEDKHTVKQVRDSLNQFRGRNRRGNHENKVMVLNKAYDDAMDRILGQSQGNQDLAKQALCLIVNAKRQLTTTEVQHALAVELGMSYLDPDNFTQIGHIVLVCCGLLTVDEESDVVRVVHYTTQDYFQNPHQKWFPYAQAKIAEICASYLQFEVFDCGMYDNGEDLARRVNMNPFYDYSAKNWGHHAREAAIPIQTVNTFLMSQAHVEAAWQITRINRLSRFYGGLWSSKGVTGLHLAAEFGVEDSVRHLLARKYQDLSSRTSREGFSPLHLAAMNGHAAVVQLLLEKGASSDMRTRSGLTPLHVAARGGYETIVQQLLDKGAEIAPLNDPEHRTPLSLAAEEGHESVVHLFLERIGDLNQAEWSPTPLVAAIHGGHQRIAALLLNKGADVHYISRDGRTPLHAAAESSSEAMISLLLNLGANPNLNGKGDYEESPFMTHFRTVADMSITRLFLEKGADVNSRRRPGTARETALHNGWYMPMVRLLFEFRANVEARDTSGETPLHGAIREGHMDIVEVFLENNADIDSQDSGGCTALFTSCSVGRKRQARFLLQHGANPNLRSIQGRTPLHVAAYGGHQAIVKFLLENGAHVDIEDEHGDASLHYAIGRGRQSIAQMLIRKGASLTSRNKHGITPLHAAAAGGNKVIVQTLLEHGANLTSRDECGKTPLQVAAKQRRESVVQLLLDKGAVLDAEPVENRGRQDMMTHQSRDESPPWDGEGIINLIQNLERSHGWSGEECDRY